VNTSAASRTAAVPAPGWQRWLWVSFAIIVLDQLTKHAVLAAFQLGEEKVITSFFSLVLAFNTGAAFSFLADAAGWQRWLFTGIAIAACALLVFLLRRGGSALFIGNLYDRVMLGKVVDFLLFHYAGWAWPAFNVADSAITIGAAALIVDSFRQRHDLRHDAGRMDT
jgi:signal peptidase II